MALSIALDPRRGPRGWATKAVAAGSLFEVALIAALVLVGLVKVLTDPLHQQLVREGVAPGFYLPLELQWPRLVGFVASALIAIAVELQAWRATRRLARDLALTARDRLSLAGVVFVSAAGVAAGAWLLSLSGQPDAPTLQALPTRVQFAVAVAMAACAIVLACDAVLLVALVGVRMRHLLVALGLVGALASIQLSVQLVDPTAFSLPWASSATLGQPLLSGFRLARPPTQHVASKQVNRILCVSARTCLVAGTEAGPRPYETTGELGFTDDGGARWSSVRTPYSSLVPFGEFSACAGRTCYVLNALLAPAHGLDLLKVSLPLRGGRLSYRLVLHEPGSPDVPVGLSCPTSRTCVIAFLGDMDTVALRTSDGGATWRSLRLPRATRSPSTQVDQLTCPTPNTCLVGTESDTVYRTTTAGASWRPISTVGLPNVWSLTCPTVTRCFMLSSTSSPRGQPPGSALLTSADAGRHWEQVPVPERWRRDGLGALSCFDATRCSMLSSSTVETASSPPGMNVALRTSDLGRTWHSVALSYRVTGFGFTCPTRNTCYATVSRVAIGEDGIHRPVPVLMVSHDGGAHWSAHVEPPPLPPAHSAIRTGLFPNPSS